MTWYKNGEPILTDQANTTSRISIYENVINTTVESILAVSLVEKEDEGVYTCQASNEDGVNSTSTTLNVRGMCMVKDCHSSSGSVTAAKSVVGGGLGGAPILFGIEGDFRGGKISRLRYTLPLSKQFAGLDACTCVVATIYYNAMR